MNRYRAWYRPVAAAALLLVAAFLAGCDPAPRQEAAAAPAGNAKAEAQLKLSPGCPLGSNSLMGLYSTVAGCQASPRLTPSGPIGAHFAP